MGVSAAVIVLIVALTGLLLNHTEDFQFDSEHVQSDWVLDWYGIRAPDTPQTFLANGRYVTLMGEHLYLNRREIEGNYSQLVGVLGFNDMFIVAISHSILLLTARGERIERPLLASLSSGGGKCQAKSRPRGIRSPRATSGSVGSKTEILTYQHYDHAEGALTSEVPVGE